MGGYLEMLRSPLDFRVMQAEGRSRADALLHIRFRQNQLDRTRYGISTGRRLGSAVVRNRVRRRLRSVLRDLEPQINLGWDVLLVARPPAAEATQAQLGETVSRLLRLAGLLEGRTR